MKKMECKCSCHGKIEENPVMILNSIARLFDARARSSGVFPDSLPHSSRRLMRILSKCEGVSMIDLVEYTHLSTQTRKMCQRIQQDINFAEAITPRRFRTTVLTDLYDMTKDIKQAQAAAGHTTAAMTLKHYVKGRSEHRNTAAPIATAYGLEN